jgi:hypothetical protein
LRFFGWSVGGLGGPFLNGRSRFRAAPDRISGSFEPETTHAQLLGLAKGR